MLAENNYKPVNNVFRKIYTKRKSRKFLLCITFLGLSKCSVGLNYTKLQKTSAQYKHSLYNQFGVAKMFYSVELTQNSREQMF